MEGEAVAAEESSGVCPAQGVDLGGLGVGQSDGRDARRAGQSRDGGNGVGAGVNAQVRTGVCGDVGWLRLRCGVRVRASGQFPFRVPAGQEDTEDDDARSQR